MAALGFGHPRAHLCCVLCSLIVASDCFLQHASVDREGRSAHPQILSGFLASVNTLRVTARDLVFQGCQVGLDISKQLQSAQPFCQTFCLCQMLY